MTTQRNQVRKIGPASCLAQQIQAAFDFTAAPAAPAAFAPSLRLAFHSGMSRAKDFHAAAAAGVPIGVVANELTSPQLFLGIPRHVSRGGHVFIDSGAFAELATGVAPDFDQVLFKYEIVADALQDQDRCRLYVVAPDKVGDQLATLERLAEHAGRVRALIELGCKVIMPLQRGVIPAADMLARAAAILGTDRFVAGIPSNKEAMSIEECATLRHHAYHILGRVQMNQEQIDRMRALAGDDESVEITADANWLRSRLGVVLDLAERERKARSLASVSASNLFAPSARAAAITAALSLEDTWGKAA